MSFSDFGRPAGRPSRATGPTRSSTDSGNGIVGNQSLAQVSESILQYQRNVGILEKVVQSLLAKNAFNNRELELQYAAQVDVVDQLKAKLERQIAQQKGNVPPQERATWVKLQRDFERVSDRAETLRSSAERMKEQANKLKTVQEETEEARQSNASIEYQQQLQLEQNRLNEEIMREREEEIRNINRGMHQVNEIYKDLAHIVASQQEQVDSIETHMEESRVNAEAGLAQVEKANEKFGTTQCAIS